MDTATLISHALFSNSETERKTAQTSLLTKAAKQGVYSASLFPLYDAIGKGEVAHDFTVLALNIRTLTFDTATMIFSLMKEQAIGPVIFEIARSELTYTNQPPSEYALAILAGALYAGYTGPVFLQADHLQVRKTHYLENPHAEIADLKDLITSYHEADFRNIDIDGSTLVDYSLETPRMQQENNAEVTALLTQYLRSLPVKDAPLAIGGEIGHIGEKNSTVVDFRSFMEQYLQHLPGIQGISKISVQTGSTHGGTPLPDGSIQAVQIDTTVLENIGKAARLEYFLGGVVQHGASTLAPEMFDAMRRAGTLEVHVATGLQNIFFDCLLPDVKEELYAWVIENEKKEASQTDEQFLYKSRKKSLGPFKKQLWALPSAQKQAVLTKQKSYLLTLFEKLNLFQTRKYLEPLYKL